MKKLCFLLLLFFGCQLDPPGPRYFKIIHGKYNWYYAFLGRQNDGKKYYLITEQNTPASITPTNAGSTDTLELIGDLLLLKGDTRICMLPVVCHLAESSKIYESQDYSIQVDALFKINQLFRKDYYRYSPAPVLMDNNTRTRECISGDIVDRAYQAYAAWFGQVKTIGLSQARKQGIMPLEGSTVSWY